MKNYLTILLIIPFFCTSTFKTSAQNENYQITLRYIGGATEYDQINYREAASYLQLNEDKKYVYQLKKQNWNPGDLFQFIVKPPPEQSDGALVYLLRKDPDGNIHLPINSLNEEGLFLSGLTVFPRMHSVYSYLKEGNEEWAFLFSRTPIKNWNKRVNALKKEDGELSKRLEQVFKKDLADSEDPFFFDEKMGFKNLPDNKIVPIIIEFKNESEKTEVKPADLFLISVGPQYPDLRYSVKDAEEVSDAFETKTGSVFETINTFNFTGINATKNKVLQQMADLKQFNPDQNDLIIFYFSGFGHLDKYEQVLKLADYDPLSPKETGLRYNELISLLKAYPCPKLLLFDASTSPALVDPKVPESLTTSNPKSGILKNFITFIANSKGEMSYEDKSWENGAFTEALLEGIYGQADQNQDGFIYISELFHFTSRRTKELVNKELRRDQTPMMPDMNFIDRVIAISGGK